MTKIAYRSVHPDVLAHYDRHTKAYKEWRDRVRTTLVDLGFPADRTVWMVDTRVVGIIHPAGEPVPEGWRRDRKKRDPVIVPARTTKLGEQYARTLGSLTQPDPRRGLPGGMPSVAMARTEIALMHCGVQEVDGAVTVTWSSELSDNDTDRIDPAIWQQIRRSEELDGEVVTPQDLMATPVHPLVAKLAATRKAAGLSYRAVAQVAGLLPTTISYWEGGRASPSLHLLDAYARALGFDIVLQARSGIE